MKVLQSNRNQIQARKAIRSTTAPEIRAGVMIAKVSWKKATAPWLSWPSP